MVNDAHTDEFLYDFVLFSPMDLLNQFAGCLGGMFEQSLHQRQRHPLLLLGLVQLLRRRNHFLQEALLDERVTVGVGQAFLQSPKCFIQSIPLPYAKNLPQALDRSKVAPSRKWRVA